MMNSRCWRREWGPPVAKEDALFNDLLLQMTRAAWHGKECLRGSSGELSWLKADAYHTSWTYKFILNQSSQYKLNASHPNPSSEAKFARQ